MPFAPRIRNVRGFSLAELLIALLLTGIVSAAAFHFFMSVNQQVLSQEEYLNLQQLNRSCLEEIASNLRSAGYGVTGDRYEAGTDTIAIFARGSVKIDTIQYYLEEYDDSAYAVMPGLVGGTSVFWLMKQTNADSAQIYADYITDLRFTVINSDLVAVTLENISTKPDATFEQDGGYRKFTNTERIAIRN